MITTTELRTKTSQLVDTLKRGSEVILIHRSKVIGKIKPKKEEVKRFDAAKFKKIIKKMDLPYLSDKEISKRYRKAMLKKHGKSLL